MTIVQAAKSNTKKKNTSSSSSSSYGKRSSSGTGGTVINGVTYGTGNGGYQTDINNAVANGDYKLAAQLEQARNNAIDSTGSSYSKTNNYSGWLDSTDYGTIGKQQMASGASAEDVYQTYLNRYNKANGTVGLQQYANDDIQQEMWDYIQANLNKPSFNLEDYLSGKPTYNSQYSSRIDDMLNQLLNRDKFSYNAMNDPLYQQYASMYNREGNRAMNDTLASAAANAGGMNSYAVTAAQQANDYYSSQLNDKIPELYQLAYSMYMDDIDNQVRDLGLLQDMDSTQYNRYRDTMSDWRNDLSFAYNMYRDNMGDWQWDKTFDYNAGRDQLSDSRYESETAYNRAMDFLSAGIMPDQSVLDAAGISQNEAANVIAAYKLANAKTYSGSPGTTPTSKTYDDEDDEPVAKTTTPTVIPNWDDEVRDENTAAENRYLNSLIQIGLGPAPSQEFVDRIFKAGGLVENKDGTVSWANGWNASNYQEKLRNFESFGGFGMFQF